MRTTINLTCLAMALVSWPATILTLAALALSNG